MEIKDLCTAQPAVETQDMICYRPDSNTLEKREKLILHENLLSVYINEDLALKLVCTIQDLPALVLGHLYTENRIQGIEDIHSIYICRDGVRARVMTTRPLGEIKKTIEVRACGCGEEGMLGRDLLSEQDDTEPFSVLPDFAFDYRQAQDLIQAFRKGAPLHQKTHGIHSCFLMYKGQIRYLCEDIGRHNALDKAIGKALIDGLDLTKCILFSSGRIPDDMIEKVIRARIPVLVSNGAPTDRAVALARKYHVILICSAHMDAMDIFSAKEFWED